MKTRGKRVSFDERILNGIGVLTAIVDSGSFAGAGERLNTRILNAASSGYLKRHGRPRKKIVIAARKRLSTLSSTTASHACMSLAHWTVTLASVRLRMYCLNHTNGQVLDCRR